MCGIFGIVANQNSDLSLPVFQKITTRLFILSESRGKEAAGLAAAIANQIIIYKQPIASSKLIKSEPYKNVLNEILTAASYSSTNKNLTQINQPLTLIGHTRLVTNGGQSFLHNNQPVIKDGLVGVHNGIIVNEQNIWNDFPSLQRQYQVDTEVLLSLFRFFWHESGSLKAATAKVFQTIKGTASIAMLGNDFTPLILATNNGSLHYCLWPGKLLIFASEFQILHDLLKNDLLTNFESSEIYSLKPRRGCLVDPATLTLEEFSLALENTKLEKNLPQINRQIINHSLESKISTSTSVNSLISTFEIKSPSVFPDYAPPNYLRRCTRCILPETMPFIEFDEAGVCNYCHNHQKIIFQGEESLRRVLSTYHRTNDAPNCLFPFSGGRDSSYALHYIKTVMGMNPIAYSYDWGMVTDLARRNQARICGHLGIEHILISADINRKRHNIRKNVVAWLKKPDLGMVPLFMAGDKQYFYYINKLAKRIKGGLAIYSENPLERTDFKSGFCGVPPARINGNIHRLPFWSTGRLAWHYSRQFATNPGYLNDSLFDTFGGFLSHYLLPHNFLFFFQYIPWEENKIISTLIDQYDWELAEDTKSSWRIGDGTTAFYNYIYGTIAGFTENDTFRSNQIREGHITRDQALSLAQEENQPRWQSLAWYCQVLNLDLLDTINAINKIPKLR